MIRWLEQDATIYPRIKMLPVSWLDGRSRIVLINQFDSRSRQERPRHGPCPKIGSLCECSLTMEGRPVSQEKYAHIQVPPFVKDQHRCPMPRDRTLTHTTDRRPLSSWKQMTEWLGHRNPPDVPREHLYVVRGLIPRNTTTWSFYVYILRATSIHSYHLFSLLLFLSSLFFFFSLVPLNPQLCESL